MFSLIIFLTGILIFCGGDGVVVGDGVVL